MKQAKAAYSQICDHVRENPGQFDLRVCYSIVLLQKDNSVISIVVSKIIANKVRQ